VIFLPAKFRDRVVSERFDIDILILNELSPARKLYISEHE